MLSDNLTSAIAAIDSYLQAVETLTLAQLESSPTNGWSMGQLLRHLLDDSEFYLSEIDKCMNTNVDAGKAPTAEGEALLKNNAFPDVRIEGSPSNAFIPQPSSKNELTSGFLTLKDEISRAFELIRKSTYKGRTKHPGLGYFSAEQWFQFIDMHLRHHLRQKKRIEAFLQSSVKK